MGSMIEALEKKGELRGEQKANRDTVGRMLGLGMSLEIIAQCVGLPLDEVRALAGGKAH